MAKNENDDIKDMMEAEAEPTEDQAAAGARGRKPKEYGLVELEEKEVAQLQKIAGQAGVKDAQGTCRIGKVKIQSSRLEVDAIECFFE